MRKKYCWVTIAVCPRLQLTSHTQPTSTLSRIKCKRYIFIKKCVRSLKFVIMIDYVSAYIYSCICIMSIQHFFSVAPSESRYIFAKGFSSCPSNSFSILLIYSAFRFYSFRSHILRQNVFVSFTSSCWIFHLLVGRIFFVVYECPVRLHCSNLSQYFKVSLLSPIPSDLSPQVVLFGLLTVSFFFIPTYSHVFFFLP